MSQVDKYTIPQTQAPWVGGKGEKNERKADKQQNVNSH